MSFKLKYNGKEKTFEKKVLISDLVEKGNRDIICCRVNNRLRELTYYVEEDATIEFLTIKDEGAAKIYESTVRFIAVMAFARLYPELSVRLTRNVSRSTFIQILNEDVSANKKMRDAIEEEMKKIIAADYPLVRHSYDKKKAAEIYKKMGLLDKLEALQKLMFIYMNVMAIITTYSQEWFHQLDISKTSNLIFMSQV